MRRASRGITVSSGTAHQETAAVNCFEAFMELTRLAYAKIDDMHASLTHQVVAPQQNLYLLMKAFSLFLQTRESTRSHVSNGFLAKATAEAYFSHILNLLKERYPNQLQDAQRIKEVEKAMSRAISARNIMEGIQTNDAPVCKDTDLHALVQELTLGHVYSDFKGVHDAAVQVMLWHTFGRSIDTCFARKEQLSIAVSGELFLHISRLKTSMVQGVSLFKASTHWQQCVFHALGVLFVCCPEPSEFVFPVVPHLACSDLPGEKVYTQAEAMVYWDTLASEDATNTSPPPAPSSSIKRVKRRPNVAKYLNEAISAASTSHARRNGVSVTEKLTSHSLRRGAASYANGCHKLAIQWISTRGAWLLDSLTKAFAYVGTTTREDQAVGGILAGYTNPDQHVVTPRLDMLHRLLSANDSKMLQSLYSDLFVSATGFDDVKLNVDAAVLDSLMASLLIQLREVRLAAAANHVMGSYYLARFSLSVEKAAQASGGALTVAMCEQWGDKLKNAWLAENCVCDATFGATEAVGIKAMLEHILQSIRSLQDSVDTLQATQAQLIQVAGHMKKGDASAPETVLISPMTVPHSLASCFFDWYLHKRWNSTKTKREQALAYEMKSAVNIMYVAAGVDVTVPAEPLPTNLAALASWKQLLWDTAQELDQRVNTNLGKIDQKSKSNRPAALRKRWAAFKLSYQSVYAKMASGFLLRADSGGLDDMRMPPKYLWTADNL